MSVELTKAIEALQGELVAIMQRGLEIKKTINQLSALNGEDPPFSDVEFNTVTGSVNIRPDQFFGKPFNTAVKEFLRMKGRAATAEEIYKALSQGGYEFSGDEKYQLRGVAISLGKSRNDFVYVKSSNAFGLWDFYPGLRKKRERGKKDDGGAEVAGENGNGEQAGTPKQ
ncbi:MAG: hypothetical protein WB626_02360 [Bacteroidota bacterium]